MKTIKIAIAIIIYAALTFAAATQHVFGQQDDLKFNQTLQNDFAAGINGDAAALARAMERADKILAANETDAETLVWHGSATLVGAGKAFQSGNFREGGALWQKGLGEMNRAVELAPNSFVVRIVRGSTALSAAKKFPDPAVAKELREKAVMDYEKILTLTDETTKKALPSQLKQIFSNLADTYEKLGDKAKADAFRQRLAQQP